MKRQYHALIAGLPQLTPDAKPPYTMKEFWDENQSSFSSLPRWQGLTAALSDRQLVRLLLLPADHRNIATILYESPDEWDSLGSYSRDQIEQDLAQAREEEGRRSHLLPYLFDYARKWHSCDAPPSRIEMLEELHIAYCHYAQRCGNTFIAQWFTLSSHLRNAMLALRARKGGVPFADAIVGTDPISEAIRTSHLKDFGISDEFPIITRLMAIADEEDIYEREHKIDTLKWSWLEEQLTFHYFTIEQLFAHIIQLQLIERWTRLDKSEGEARFKGIVLGMKETIKNK